MGNQNFSVFPERKANAAPKLTPPKPGRAARSDMPMKTANWGGLPGGTGPNRSNGVTRAKIHPQSDGI